MSFPSVIGDVLLWISSLGRSELHSVRRVGVVLLPAPGAPGAQGLAARRERTHRKGHGLCGGERRCADRGGGARPRAELLTCLEHLSSDSICHRPRMRSLLEPSQSSAHEPPAPGPCPPLARPARQSYFFPPPSVLADCPGYARGAIQLLVPTCLHHLLPACCVTAVLSRFLPGQYPLAARRSPPRPASSGTTRTAAGRDADYFCLVGGLQYCGFCLGDRNAVLCRAARRHTA